MNRYPRLFLFPLFAVLLLGCEPNGGAETEDDPAAMTDTTSSHTLTLAGDFDGPLGLQLWSLREYTKDDVAGALARVHAMGIREVELAGTYGMKPAAYRQMLDEAGLMPTSMHTGYERFRDSLNVVLDEAVTLGVPYVGLAWIPHDNEQPFTDAMAREAAAHFNTWGAAAQARDLQFFYHVHGYEFRPNDDGSTPFDVLVAETDPDAVKFEMDVFWVTHPGVDPAALLRKYPDRWALMHIKDMKQGTPTPDYSGHATAEADVPIGTGMIDYAAVLEAAEEIGLSRYFIEDESTAPLEHIPQSIAFLESVKF